MLNTLSFLAENTEAYVYMGVKIALAALILICSGFIIFVVMKQSGNTDGIEAMTGSAVRNDDSESYYGKNTSERKESKLKLWTYICGGVLALAAIAFLILTAVIG